MTPLLRFMKKRKLHGIKGGRDPLHGGALKTLNPRAPQIYFLCKIDKNKVLGWAPKSHHRMPISSFGILGWDGDKPILWVGFIDDIFKIWLHSEESLKKWVVRLNNF